MVRFALINAGARGAAIARLAHGLQNFTVTAVVEPEAKAAADLARLLGAGISETSTERLHELHDDEFDCYLACTACGWLIVPQANRPLAWPLEAWQNHPQGWMWGQAFRFLPSVQTVKESLDSGKLGEPGLVRIHHWQTKAAGDVRQALLAQLDLACWLVGLSPTLLYAQGRKPLAKDFSQLDYLQVHLGFAGDRMAIVDCATSLPAGEPYYSLSVIGSTGAAYADDHRNMQLRLGGEHIQAIPTTQGDTGLLATLQEYLAATGAARLPACGAEQWSRAWHLLKATEESLRTGESVSLPRQESP